MKDFEKIYKKVKKMAPKHHFEFKNDPFWILITTILSQRTKDKTTDEAARSLYNRYKNSHGLENADSDDIKKIIKNVGFSNVKSKRLIDVSKIINRDYSGKVPDNHDELIKIPGVGSKTANIVLTQGYDIPAIAVDTHVFRISNRIGLVKTKNPDETEEALKKIIPLKDQIEFNPIFVEFGKNICKPISPKCAVCLLTECCDYYINSKEIKNKK